MTKEELKRLIKTAKGEIKADLVIKNCRRVDVYTGEITQGDIAISGSLIAGFGEYSGETEIDAGGLYAIPGLIDSHIHIESGFVSPEELGRLLVPHGTSTIIADPHEIVNVCGLKGFDYMLRASEHTALDIKLMLPSCVPATGFESSGAVLEASDMAEPLGLPEVPGLGEFMNFPGILEAEDAVLDKIMAAKRAGKLIDGHSPGLSGKALQAYASAGILGDHECTCVEELRERLSLGMYVLIRQGSACHDLKNLLPGITAVNSRRCLLCSDDRQPQTILSEGHIDSLLRLCVSNGLDALTALRMATLNAAEAFRLYDRGAIAPGLRADIALVDNLKDFKVSRMFIEGRLAAEDGRYLPEVKREPFDSVASTVRLKDFSIDKLRLHLKSEDVKLLELVPGGILTKNTAGRVRLDETGNFVFNPEQDIAKIAVVERHSLTGNAACALLKGYGIKKGAIALTVAHDSHNIITVGVSDEEMAFAVKALELQGGGIVLAAGEKVIENLPLPICGLMSDRSGEWVAEKFTALRTKARSVLSISEKIEPIMTLCFLALPVIPEIRLTDKGLFDVKSFSFVPIERE